MPAVLAIFNEPIMSWFSPPGLAGKPYAREVGWKQLKYNQAFAEMLWRVGEELSSVAFEGSKSMQQQQRKRITCLFSESSASHSLHHYSVFTRGPWAVERHHHGPVLYDNTLNCWIDVNNRQTEKGSAVLRRGCYPVHSAGFGVVSKTPSSVCHFTVRVIVSRLMTVHGLIYCFLSGVPCWFLNQHCRLFYSFSSHLNSQPVWEMLFVVCCLDAHSTCFSVCSDFYREVWQTSKGFFYTVLPARV